MDVDISSALLGLGRVQTKLPAAVASQAAPPPTPAWVAAQVADTRRAEGLTRVRKASSGPFAIDRFASELYPLPPPCLAADVVVASTGARYLGR